MARPVGIELIRVGNLSNPVPPQVSCSLKLVYFERGTKLFYYRRQWRTAEAGHLLLIPAGEVHSAEVLGVLPVTLRVLSIGDAALARIADEMSLLLPLTPRERDPFVKNTAVICAFRQLHRAPEDFTSALEQQIFLLRLLESLRLHTARSQEKSTTVFQHELGPINKVKRYIEEHYFEDIQLAQLAQAAHLAPAYLCRTFAKSVGMPPHAYLIAVRVARARELLRQGCPAGQAALETGFYDQAHFTRHFSRVVQMPPARYARQVNSVQDDLRL